MWFTFYYIPRALHSAWHPVGISHFSVWCFLGPHHIWPLLTVCEDFALCPPLPPLPSIYTWLTVVPVLFISSSPCSSGTFLHQVPSVSSVFSTFVSFPLAYTHTYIHTHSHTHTGLWNLKEKRIFLDFLSPLNFVATYFLPFSARRLNITVYSHCLPFPPQSSGVWPPQKCPYGLCDPEDCSLLGTFHSLGLPDASFWIFFLSYSPRHLIPGSHSWSPHSLSPQDFGLQYFSILPLPALPTLTALISSSSSLEQTISRDSGELALLPPPAAVSTARVTCAFSDCPPATEHGPAPEHSSHSQRGPAYPPPPTPQRNIIGLSLSSPLGADKLLPLPKHSVLSDALPSSGEAPQPLFC